MAEPENKLGGHNLVQGRHDSMVVVWLPCELLVPCSIPNGDSFFFSEFQGCPTRHLLAPSRERTTNYMRSNNMRKTILPPHCEY